MSKQALIVDRVTPAEHVEGCKLRRAILCPVGFECPHGEEVCNKCDPCTCEARILSAMGVPADVLFDGMQRPISGNHVSINSYADPFSPAPPPSPPPTPDPLADPSKRAAYYGAAALLPESENPLPSRFLCLACVGTGGSDLGLCRPCRGAGSVDARERIRQGEIIHHATEAAAVTVENMPPLRTITVPPLDEETAKSCEKVRDAWNDRLRSAGRLP